MNKKAAIILILIYSISVFSASAQLTKGDWECPSGIEFPMYQDDKVITAQCGPNGTSVTLYGCENITNVESGPCYQEPETVKGKISESTEEIRERIGNQGRQTKVIVAAGILIALSVFIYEYFHG